MTNKDAVISEVQVGIASDNAVEKALIDQNLNGLSDYDSSYKKEVAMAALAVLKGLLATKSVQEGGFTLTIQVEKRILDIQSEYNLLPVAEVVPVVIPKVRRRSVC